MKLGYNRLLTEKDVWKLDNWDRTETLNNMYVEFPDFFCIYALHRLLLWDKNSQVEQNRLITLLNCLGSRNAGLKSLEGLIHGF